MRVCFVDSFTDAVFRGNPAAVCFTGAAPEKTFMQAIAREIGFSETAFVGDRDKDGFYPICYFSPQQEIPLCGHATLAAAKIIAGSGTVNNLQFRTANGVVLPVRREDEYIVMQFPVYNLEPFTAPLAMLKALGLETVVHAAYSPVNKIVLLEINRHRELAALKPDFTALLASYTGINGVLVTATSDNEDFDFYYRYFWPWAGTNEDPVTGGVQTFLTKYWVQKSGNNTLHACQCSERGGTMKTVFSGDSVSIYGKAVLWLEGEIRI